MLIRTPTDFGAIIRDRRKKLGMGQAELAAQIDVSRQWVVSIERGHSRAELGLILRALDTLGIRLDAKDSDAIPPTARPGLDIDIDAIVRSARKAKS